MEQKPRLILRNRSLGDQLDAWCDMLAAASSAVAREVRPAPPPGPPPPHPHGRLGGLGGTTPHRPPPAPPSPTTGRGGGGGAASHRLSRVTVARKRSTKKAIATTAAAGGHKEERRKVASTAGGGRHGRLKVGRGAGTRSQRRDSAPNTTMAALSLRSSSWTSLSRSVMVEPVPGRGASGSACLLPGPPACLSPAGLAGTVRAGRGSETDESDSDGDCVEEEDEEEGTVRATRSPGNQHAVLPLASASGSSLGGASSGLEGALEGRTFPLSASHSLHAPLALSAASWTSTTSLNRLVPLSPPLPRPVDGPRCPQQPEHTHTPQFQHHQKRTVKLQQEQQKQREYNKEQQLQANKQHQHQKVKQHTQRRSTKSISPGAVVASGRAPAVAQERSESRPAEGVGDKKRKGKPSLINMVKPVNQEVEKAKFMEAKNFSYNPLFQYRYVIDYAAYKNYFRPEFKLLPLAVKVLQNALSRHGSYERFADQSGGDELTTEQVLRLAHTYLREEGLEDEVQVKLSPDLVSRACMTRVRGRPLLQIQTSNVHEGWMDGLLRHEIGTHYLRSCNNRCQPWRKPRRRRELALEPANPTEEGLASLHSVIFREEPCMWRAAMLYYAVARASELSFSGLFKDLGKFVKDAEVRWDYCLRAKRGLSNTAEQGAFSKDQVYLKGALEILRNRKNIDFHALLRLGKVSYRDIDRLLPLANMSATRIPRFMRDIDFYRSKLTDILTKNGLCDEDLQSV